MTTEDIHALAGAYALDAVDDLERVAFQRHLDDCEACRVEVDELRETAARLADGAWSVPPPRLRTDVQAAIGRTRQLPPTPAAPPQPEVNAAVPLRRRFAMATAAAVILAAGASVATYGVQEQRVHEANVAAAEVRAQQARVQAILASPDVVLRTAPVRGGGNVTVAMSVLQNAGVVMLGARSAPGPGKAYQFWTTKGLAAPKDAGLLAAGATETTQVIDGMPANDGFAITVEPATGSVTPTQPTVAQVSLV